MLDCNRVRTPQHNDGETSDRTYQPGQMRHPDKPCSSEKSTVGNPTADTILRTVKGIPSPGCKASGTRLGDKTLVLGTGRTEEMERGGQSM